MTGPVLIVDDDPSVRRIVRRVLESKGFRILEADNGEQCLSLTRAEKPELIIMDIDMPVKNGKETIQELRRNSETQMIPVIFLTGAGEVLDKVSGFELGADDYIVKPFGVLELEARVESLVRRTQRALSANPLTLLPGSPAIKAEVDKRIREKQSFAFLYIDIDNFKAFNDSYGYLSGDKAIKETASLLIRSVEVRNETNSFVGHIGGDDFVMLVPCQMAEKVAQDIAAFFDSKAPYFYKDEDRQKGFILSKDRQGQERQFPLMTLSIAIVDNEKHSLNHYGQAVDIAFELKRLLKDRKNEGKSAYFKNRRD